MRAWRTFVDVQLAGLVARGNVERVVPSMPVPLLRVMQVLLLMGLTDTEDVVRSTTNNIVSTVARHRLQGWADLFPFLQKLMDPAGNPAYVVLCLCWGRCNGEEHG